MTIHLLSKASGNPNLDLVFDPYVEGTKPPSTGLLDDSGSDIVNRYAPIVYGSQAAATGLLTEQAGHADINTLFAAYGTTRYPLPIDGGTYTTTLTRDGSAGAQSAVIFAIVGSIWSLEPSGIAGTISPSGNFASGSLPSGSSTVEFTTSNHIGTAVSITGTTGSYLAVSGNPSLKTFTTAAGTIGTSDGSIDVTVNFKDGSGIVISTTTYTAHMVIQN